ASPDDASLLSEATKTQALGATVPGAVEHELHGRGSADGSVAASGPWSSNLGATTESDALETPLVPPPSTSLARDPNALGSAIGPSTVTVTTPQSEVGDDDVAFESLRASSSQRVVSLAVAVTVALLFGASGFTSGYLLGTANQA